MSIFQSFLRDDHTSGWSIASQSRGPHQVPRTWLQRLNLRLPAEEVSEVFVGQGSVVGLAECQMSGKSQAKPLRQCIFLWTVASRIASRWRISAGRPARPPFHSIMPSRRRCSPSRDNHPEPCRLLAWVIQRAPTVSRVRVSRFSTVHRPEPWPSSMKRRDSMSSRACPPDMYRSSHRQTDSLR
jgi:hypothetical protein